MLANWGGQGWTTAVVSQTHRHAHSFATFKKELWPKTVDLQTVTAEYIGKELPNIPVAMSISRVAVARIVHPIIPL